MFGFGKHWVKADGVILAQRQTGIGDTKRTEYVVEVRPADALPFRGKVKEPQLNRHFLPPSDGDTVGVEYDPGSQDVRFDSDDGRTNLQVGNRAWQAAQEDRFDAALRGAVMPPSATGDPELDELARLMEEEAQRGRNRPPSR
jgi:hypothetical protein